MNPVARDITRRFVGSNGMWVVEKDRQAEALLFQEAVAEIERLEEALAAAETSIAEGLKTHIAELEAARTEYVESVKAHDFGIMSIRNAAKSLVTQIDKARKED